MKNRFPPMKRSYRVDHCNCNIMRPVEVYGIGDEEVAPFKIDICMSDPKRYCMQFCMYRKEEPQLSVSEINEPQTGIEEIVRAQCLKKHLHEKK